MNTPEITTSGYKYRYSPNLNTFILTSFNCLSDIEQDFGEYSTKKNEFLKEKAFFVQTIPSLDVNYDIAFIESNLANLRQLLIEVTDDCNLACKYCGYGKLYGNYDERKGEKQNFENVKALIDYLAELWRSHKNLSFDNLVYIGFYGGEPLMNFPLIKQTIEYVESLKISGLVFQYNMTTNAVLLSKYMDYLAEKKFHLLISLDGSKEHNRYRVTKAGKESFDKVFLNALLLKEKYPDYFDTHVEFNAVLHNYNSVANIFQYIKNIFNKSPRIAELNTNGITDNKIDEFYSMFINKTDSLNQSLNCENLLIDDMINTNPEILQLNSFIEAYSGNTYRTMPDLFFAANNQRDLPTNTCPPFYKKIFLTVQGKILPCEKIGQKFPLGYVKDGYVNVDINYIKDFYAKLYTDIVEQCKKCFLWKNCNNCIYFLPRDKKGKVTCPYFLGPQKISEYFSKYLSILENKPELYEQIVNEIMLD